MCVVSVSTYARLWEQHIRFMYRVSREGATSTPAPVLSAEGAALSAPAIFLSSSPKHHRTTCALPSNQPRNHHHPYFPDLSPTSPVPFHAVKPPHHGLPGTSNQSPHTTPGGNPIPDPQGSTHYHEHCTSTAARCLGEPCEVLRPLMGHIGGTRQNTHLDPGVRPRLYQRPPRTRFPSRPPSHEPPAARRDATNPCADAARAGRHVPDGLWHVPDLGDAGACAPGPDPDAPCSGPGLPGAAGSVLQLAVDGKSLPEREIIE